MVNNLCDVLLCFKRVVGILDEKNGFPRVTAERFIYKTKFGRDPDLTITG